MPKVIKQNGNRVVFDEEKLRQGLLRALEKRPVSVERVEAAVNRIKQKLRALGDREIKSIVIGEQVMDELRLLDKVAYVRFASVYRSFEDVKEFSREVEALEQYELQMPKGKVRQ